MSEESRVTAADISGLRDDTRRLADSIDSVALEQKTISTAVQGKAEQSDVKELDRLAHRANINSTLAVLAVVVALAAVIGLFVFITVQRNNDDAKTLARRTADCHSMDDVGSAIKAGAAVITDPRAADFVAQYNAAVDKAVATAKERKGYSADCTQIGSPPKPGG